MKNNTLGNWLVHLLVIWIITVSSAFVIVEVSGVILIMSEGLKMNAIIGLYAVVLIELVQLEGFLTQHKAEYPSKGLSWIWSGLKKWNWSDTIMDIVFGIVGIGLGVLTLWIFNK